MNYISVNSKNRKNFGSQTDVTMLSLIESGFGESCISSSESSSVESREKSVPVDRLKRVIYWQSSSESSSDEESASSSDSTVSESVASDETFSSQQTGDLVSLFRHGSLCGISRM